MDKEIKKVKDLLETNLTIPNYQRPYKWTIKNINQLIDDIIEFRDKTSYRLGTIVIHKEKDNDKLNIVDGQQRTITLTLIAEALKDSFKEKYGINSSLLSCEFSNPISRYNIQNNYSEIKRRIKEFDENEDLVQFFFEKCEVVVITLTDISEAFQFFDSQNARGKDLEPHDLLKAYHLREMQKLEESEKIEAIKNGKK